MKNLTYSEAIMRVKELEEIIKRLQSYSAVQELVIITAEQKNRK